jgi:hypothetical protein
VQSRERHEALARLWDHLEFVNREVPVSEDFSTIAADPIASALDGRHVRGTAQPWVARVTSVYRDERTCWVQVAKDGDATASVLLRCSKGATPEHIAATLAHWPPLPAWSLLVLRVMSAV